MQRKLRHEDLAVLTSRQVLKNAARRTSTANSPSDTASTTNPHSPTAISISGFHQSLDIIKNTKTWIFGKKYPGRGLWFRGFSTPLVVKDAAIIVAGKDLKAVVQAMIYRANAHLLCNNLDPQRNSICDLPSGDWKLPPWQWSWSPVPTGSAACKGRVDAGGVMGSSAAEAAAWHADNVCLHLFEDERWKWRPHGLPLISFLFLTLQLRLFFFFLKHFFPSTRNSEVPFSREVQLQGNITKRSVNVKETGQLGAKGDLCHFIFNFTSIFFPNPPSSTGLKKKILVYFFFNRENKWVLGLYRAVTKRKMSNGSIPSSVTEPLWDSGKSQFAHL